MHTSLNVVICDDDPNQRDTIRLCFEVSGARHEIAEFELGSDMVDHVMENDVDLVLLDMGLPDVDGLEALGSLRVKSDVPVIVVSGNHAVDVVARALAVGADDYITKPFDVLELIARVEAVTRRASGKAADRSTFSAPGVKVDFNRKSTTINGTSVELNLTEWDVLRALASEPGVVIEYSTLKKQAWGDTAVSDAAVHMAIRRLRQKVEACSGDDGLIRSHRGIGYSIEVG